jgi:type I restriction enzyme S subunit
MKNQSLKPDWRRVKFGDVVRLSKARCADPLAEGIERFVGLEHLEPSDLRIRSWGNVADGVTFTSMFEPGQVLFGKRRAYQRKVAVADFSGVCSGDIYVLESQDADALLPELLPFICQTDAFFEHAVGTSAGSLSPRTNWTSLANFGFVLPSKGEQRRIVFMLGALEENLVALDAALASAITLEFSRLEDALDSVPCDRLVPVEKLVTTGPRNGHSPKVNADLRGYPTLSISAVRDGRIITEGNVKYAEVTDEQAASQVHQWHLDESNTVEAYWRKFSTTCSKTSGPAMARILSRSGQPVAVNVRSRKAITAAPTRASAGAVSPAPTFRVRRRKCWLKNGCARR